MTKMMWEFRLDGIKHKVEIEHGYWSRNLSALVDGSKSIRFLKNKETFDLGSKNPFQIDNHPCAVVIIPNSFKYEYDLEVDGYSVVTGKSNDLNTIRASQLKWIRWPSGFFIMLLGLIMGLINWWLLHTKGYFYDKIAYFTPMFIFLPIYFMVFPQEFVDQYHRRLSVRMWILIVVFILLGFAHMFALGHGLY